MSKCKSINKVCPEHQLMMITSNTRYGVRRDCPNRDCDYVGWNGNTPANKQTRFARILAHETFDRIWRAGILPRSRAYKSLAVYLNKTQGQTHIAKFSFAECHKVLNFCEELDIKEN